MEKPIMTKEAIAFVHYLMDGEGVQVARNGERFFSLFHVCVRLGLHLQDERERLADAPYGLLLTPPPELLLPFVVIPTYLMSLDPETFINPKAKELGRVYRANWHNAVFVPETNSHH